MMPSIIPFSPSNISAPSFTAIFDGVSYTVFVTWNASAQRFYVNIYDITGSWVLTTPLVTTPGGEAVSSVTFDPMSGLISITKATGLYRKPGQIVRYTLVGFEPTVLNGFWRCLTIDTLNFTFPINSDPGPITTTGTVHRLMNMIGTIFTQSTLVYRNGNFEVNP